MSYNKVRLSLALLYLVDLFMNKLKTKFNNLFYRMGLNTKRIEVDIYLDPSRLPSTT